MLIEAYSHTRLRSSVCAVSWPFNGVRAALPTCLPAGHGAGRGAGAASGSARRGGPDHGLWAGARAGRRDFPLPFGDNVAERGPPAATPYPLACPLLLPPPLLLQDGPYPASLQAIKRHEFTGLLEQPGTADLSNRVDYSALRCVGRYVSQGAAAPLRCYPIITALFCLAACCCCRSTVAECGAAAECLGPIPQSHFLLGLGIEARLQQLLASATPQQAEALQAGFRWATGASSAGKHVCPLCLFGLLNARSPRLLLQAVGGRQRAGGGAT